MKTMIKLLLSGLFILSVANSCQNIKAGDSGDESVTSSNEHLTSAVLYQQTAAEYRALCYQAFNVARLQLDKSLRVMGLMKQQAVVVDIDETVLDNSPFEAKSILEGTSYPTYWNEWVEMANARAVPGALEFLKYAESKGIEIYYITNRREKYRQPTLKNLQDLSFPFSDNGHLFMRTDESSKKARRETVSEKHKIILLIGDNLNDFSEVFEKKSITDRFELVDKFKEDFGNRFIVLPNAVYGEWEGAIYDYDFSKTADEKFELRHNHLQSF